jgi:hypothetical protein
MSAPGKGASVPTPEHDAATRSRIVDQLVEITMTAEAQLQEYQAARRELDEAARTLGARIVAAEDAMRGSRRRFISVLREVAPGCVTLTYNSSHRNNAQLQADLDDVMGELRERGVNLSVVLAEWLGAGNTVVDANWRPSRVEFEEAVNMAARIAADRRRRV